MGRVVSRGNRAIRWIEEFCRIPEGPLAGKPVKLLPFQKKVIKGIYDQPTRRVIISFGRKNAKTTLSGFLCLLHLCGPEARINSQLYSAAQSRDQAGILFNLMAKTIRMSPDLQQVVTIRESAKQLFCEELGTLYRALSAEASTAYGLSPVFVVHDELGQVRGPRSQLYEALETASGAQINPLSVIISTQAPTDGDLLSVLIDDAAGGHDPKTRLFLFTAPETVDPFSVEAIKAANPAYGHFLNPEEVRDQAESARRMPSAENGYRNLVLNQRIAAESPFVPRKIWLDCSAPALPSDFSGGVVIGVDLSERSDLTALVAVGRGADGGLGVRCEFFLPQDGIAEKSLRDRVPYDLWAAQGYITLTPGATVEYAYVAQRLIEWCEEYQVDSIPFDRWGMKYLKSALQHLGAEDLPLEDHGQGFKDMAPALSALEAELLNGRLRHGGNPVLTWCAANARVTKDPAGNRKFNKAKLTGRIDGMVALAMAAGRAMVNSEPEPQYQMLIVGGKK